MAVGAPTSIWRLTPLAAAGGLALAVAAWTLPTPGTAISDQAQADLGPAPGGAPANSLDKYKPKIPSNNWSRLVPLLSAVRSPPPEIEPEVIITKPETTPGYSPLHDWVFGGVVEEPDGLVAIVSIAGKQNYFRIGQIVMIDGGRTEAEIAGVEMDEEHQKWQSVIVKIEGDEHRVTVDGPTGDAAPGRAPQGAGDPGRVDPLMNPSSARGRGNPPRRP